MIKVAVLGSTGSIGTQALKVLSSLKEEFKVHALTAHSNIELLVKQIKEFSPSFAGIINRSSKCGEHVNIVCGEECLEQAVLSGVDKVIVATSGITALKAVLLAIENNIDVLLANKESLVCGGEIIAKALKNSRAKLLPVDSEHSAIFQCLQGQQGEIRKLLLTASGGAFRGYTYEELKNVTPEQALKHPNWKMGNKITIDSATLMNKGLEIIEAKWLFNVPIEKIEVLIHPQSVIHSAVEFVDGSVLAQLGMPDMCLPIQYALTYPNRKPCGSPKLDLLKTAKLEFLPPDEKTFHCLKLAKAAGTKGGLMPTVLCSANDLCVEKFINGRLKFNEIAGITANVLDRLDSLKSEAVTYLNILSASNEAVALTNKIIDKETEC